MTSQSIEQKLAKAIEDQLTTALFGPVRKTRQTALRVRGRTFETVEIDDAGNVIEPPPPCCYGRALHAPNCRIWCT